MLVGKGWKIARGDSVTCVELRPPNSLSVVLENGFLAGTWIDVGGEP